MAYDIMKIDIEKNEGALLWQGVFNFIYQKTLNYDKIARYHNMS